MQPVELIGKGAEILRYIALEEPSNPKLRVKWSSRTVTKQLRRLQTQGLVEHQNHKYQVTDAGLYNLLDSMSVYPLRNTCREIAKVAARKFPEGETMKAFGWMLKTDPIKREDIRQDQLKRLDECVQMARTMIESGKSQPHHSLSMEVFADKQGYVGFSYSIKENKKLGRIGSMTNDQFTKWLAAVRRAGRTPKQQKLLKSVLGKTRTRNRNRGK